MAVQTVGTVYVRHQASHQCVLSFTRYFTKGCQREIMVSVNLIVTGSAGCYTPKNR